MATLLLDENIEGYAGYLSRMIFSASWGDLGVLLGLRLVTFDDVGLVRSTPDQLIWELCQQQGIYLVTDNRNEDSADSLETAIRTRGSSTSLPVFTISDSQRFRSERDYAEAVVAKLLEYLVDAENLVGTGRLYLP